MIRWGQFHVGSVCVVGEKFGKIKQILRDGKPVREGKPGDTVEIRGIECSAGSGEWIMEVKNEWEANNVVHYRKRHAAFLESLQQRRLGLDSLRSDASSALSSSSSSSDAVSPSNTKQIHIPLVIKADVDGSVQAIEQQIEGLNADLENAHFEVVTANVGDVSQGDVETARDCKGILLLFNAKLNRRFLPRFSYRFHAKTRSKSQNRHCFRLYNLLPS